MNSISLYQNIGDELELGMLDSIQTIQTLWGGYGNLIRVKFSQKSIIIKHIKLPKKSEHPKGWNSSLSHQRKLKSYQVEVNWYKKYSKKSDSNCPMPQGLKSYQSSDETLIVMEDLSTIGFSNIISEASSKHLYSSIKWLSNFHAKYLHTKDELLWKEGTYWHLETRPDELEVLEDIELKKFAKLIDEELKNSAYQTLVHGDAKLANFCFNSDGSACAAVDFQYVGHGCAMKDLILFISSAVKPQECAKMETWILNTYFKEFHIAIKHYHPNLDSLDIEKKWRPLFYVAWADFLRFIKGWSPNHYKINSYSEDFTKKALDYLKSKYRI